MAAVLTLCCCGADLSSNALGASLPLDVDLAGSWTELQPGAPDAPLGDVAVGPRFPMLEKLTLAANLIDTDSLGRFCLEGMAYLRVLDLRANRLAALPVGLFRSLPQVPCVRLASTRRAAPHGCAYGRTADVARSQLQPLGTSA